MSEQSTPIRPDAGLCASHDEFRSSRRFRLWRYSLTTRQLLLRSDRDTDHETRIEIAFQNVRRVQLPMELDGLCIHRLSARTFALEGHKWRGRVDAGFMTVAEEQGSGGDALISEHVGGDGAGPEHLCSDQA